MNKVIYEGWTAQDFINVLEPQLDMIQNGQSWMNTMSTRLEIKNWCMDNQPYYKKYIKKVVDYFCKRYNIK